MPAKCKLTLPFLYREISSLQNIDFCVVVECIADESFRFSTFAIIHKPFSFFLHWNFLSQYFFSFLHLPFVFFCVVKCLRAEPKSRCWSQVYAITLTLQNTRVACSCDCKRKLTQLCVNIFLMCKFGVEPLKNDTAAITLHTQSESQHAMRILAVESAFHCMREKEKQWLWLVHRCNATDLHMWFVSVFYF